MPSGSSIILILKIATSAVTLVFLTSLIALARKNVRLHGRINLVFFLLTMVAVLAFELLIRVGPYLEPGWSVTRDWTDEQRFALRIHLGFVIPLTAVLPLMLFTGYRHWRIAHLTLAVVFSILWLGMLVTGVGFLPHSTP
jgi:chromate transport protein ChrA